MHRTRFIDSALAIVFVYVTFLVSCSSTPTGVVSGELKKWQPITVTFEGPLVGEDVSPDPPLDYRLMVTFTHDVTGNSYVIPGYLAANGNAGKAGTTECQKWRVHFTPDEEGEWLYRASFRQGTNVAVDLDPFAGRAVSFDGATGSFAVSATDTQGGSHLGKGIL